MGELGSFGGGGAGMRVFEYAIALGGSSLSVDNGAGGGGGERSGVNMRPFFGSAFQVFGKGLRSSFHARDFGGPPAFSSLSACAFRRFWCAFVRKPGILLSFQRNAYALRFFWFCLSSRSLKEALSSDVYFA